MLDEALLYDLNDSPFCLKARICLQLKGIPFRRVTLTLGRRRELRRLSPPCKVPVLVDGTDVIADSSRIVRYLERLHPEPRLIPSDPTARAYALLIEEWADEALYFVVGAFKWLNPEKPAGGARQYDERARRRRAAAARRDSSWPATSGVATPHGATPRRTLNEFEERMRDNLSQLATLLSGKRFLLGGAATDRRRGGLRAARVDATLRRATAPRRHADRAALARAARRRAADRCGARVLTVAGGLVSEAPPWPPS
jgi:glutathione S-transferase